MSGDITAWSTTADDNQSSDGDITLTEGMNSKKMNDAGRQIMGRIAEFLEDLCGTQTVGGTANAITVTLDSGFSTLANKRVMGLRPASDNTGATTLNVNSIGAKAIRKFDSTGEVALASGDLQAGNVYLLIYSTAANSSAGAWILLNPTAQPQNSKLTDIAALTPTDGNFIVGNGTTWTAESGSTAIASLGLDAAVSGPASATDSNFVAFDGTTGKLIKDSSKSSSSFATSTQGGKADSAIQPATDNSSIAAGYAATADNDGTQSSGTYTPTYAGGNLKRIVNGGAFTFAAPSASGDYTLVVQVTNNGSAGAITFSGFSKTSGDSFTTTNGDDFFVFITKINGFKSAVVQALQ